MMTLKRQLTTIVLVLASFIKIFGQTAQEQPFPYPVPPESLETLSDRASFIVEKFWERCNLKSIFSSKKKFEKAFDDYVSFMPYADSAAVFQSVEKLLKEVKKTPANMATMANTARAKLYSDSADYVIDAVYIPFAKAAAQCKALTSEQREQFATEATKLENSLIGHKAPVFTMTTRDGATMTLDDVKGGYVLIMFDDPDDFDNILARARLSTDYALNELIAGGQMKMISLSDAKPDEAWRERVKDYPANWIVAAYEGADKIFDRRVKPTYYYLNANHQILSKTLQADNLTEAFRQVLRRHEEIKAERERLRREAEARQKTNTPTAD